MLSFVYTTNTCKHTDITILQCELDIYIYPRLQHCLEGDGAVAISAPRGAYYSLEAISAH